LGPHINESGIYFEVNQAGEIRFGLRAIKGAGEAAVESIIKEREQHGPYVDIFDFARRVNQRSVNKKTFECLALSGAFDCFTGIHRRQYVYSNNGEPSLIEKAIKFAARMQQEEQSAQVSLFGGGSATPMPKPKIDPVEPFNDIEKLNLEKEVVGIYISGHPLDNFRFELETFTNAQCSLLADLDKLEGKELKLGGIVSQVDHRTTKTGKPFGRFTLEDYSGSYTFTLFGEDYLKYRNYMNIGWFVFVEGTVARKPWGDQSLEFKMRNIDLLNEIGVKRSRGLQVKVSAAALTNEIIESIEKVCQAYKGDVPLYLRITDRGDVNLELLSRKYRISPVNDMVKRMRKVADVDVMF
jgi:DNA polymerase-3 subunit alpha